MMKLLGPGLFIFLGAGIVFWGIMNSRNTLQKRKSYHKAQAFIVGIKTDAYSHGGRRLNTPVIEYVANNKKYRKQLDYGTSQSMAVGTSMEVYYNPQRPIEILTDYDFPSIMGPFLILFGALWILGGGYIVYSIIFAKR